MDTRRAGVLSEAWARPHLLSREAGPHAHAPWNAGAVAFGSSRVATNTAQGSRLAAFHPPRCAARAVRCAGMEDGERPWLKPHVHTPAARDPKPGETRKRPLIYVYDLPAIYNSIFLQVGGIRFVTVYVFSIFRYSILQATPSSCR